MSKEKNKYKSKGVAIDIVLAIVALPIIGIAVCILFWRLEVDMLNENYDFLYVVGLRGKEIFTLTFAAWVMVILFMFKMFQFKKPVQDDDLAAARWATEKEQREFFAITSIDTNETLTIGGPPVNKLDRNEVLYEKEAVHSLCVGSTRSGKSRKIIRQLVMICSMAMESMIFNDPKKEFYQDFHKYLKKRGYEIYVIDLRNLQYSDCWNPLNNIIQCINEGKVDDADQYAEDIVAQIVVDNGAGEKIWLDGQKAMIKGIILSVCSANIPEDRKNFYSVYQTLALLGGEIPVNDKHSGSKAQKMVLSMFMESLNESDTARVAYTAVANAPERTKGSFMTSALATLHTFSTRKLAKVLSRSDFKFSDFTEGKKALFVVNPDEKNTYDSVAGMIFDQSYQELVFEANGMPGRKLKKRVHNIYDEFGNMPKVNNFQRKITVALSREIVYHLYVQDYGQMDEIYGPEVAKTIRSNCNLKYFISSSDYATCEEMSKQIGNETLWVDNLGGNYSQTGSNSGGNVGWSKQSVPLKDANKLMSADNRDGNGIIVTRLYTQPMEVYLPDASEYDWYKEMEHDETEVERDDQTLKWAVPRFFEFTTDKPEMEDEDMFNAAAKHFMKPGAKLPNEKNMLWYWSSRSDLRESVEHHIKQKKSDADVNGELFAVENYLKSKEFSTWLQSVDIDDQEESSIPDVDLTLRMNNPHNNQRSKLEDIFRI
ncbi:VirD4-like conjugal transfer protein, CD1115 family [Breznakia pachnodae]|uniref:Type IV secretory pathway TraG/TraD family ATPase VirD4 n=1 Tax=Breznakia pachnodae TaxID=265178 RepID=A0ABU0E4D4_9FIRM|nr:type IV secretory system conjugative DNA transfer family protein [Breznakia pachnodae]MDQ0361553.1 type IV secretory pathway TraG/TraD family ATPase VirD4 [Breznakia pachnodae]